MTFGTHNKLLKMYGKGAVESLYNWARINAKYSDASVYGTLEASLASRLEELTKQYSKKDSVKIVESMADTFLERGNIEFAYYLYNTIESKKAKEMKKIFPEKDLELNVEYLIKDLKI
jgi:hypothetical protein